MTYISPELKAIRERYKRRTEPDVSIVDIPQKDTRVSIVDTSGQPVKRKPYVYIPPEKSTLTKVKDRVVNDFGNAFDYATQGYKAKADDTKKDVFIGALKEFPKTATEFFTKVGEGEAEAAKSTLGYVDRFGVGKEYTKKIISALDEYSNAADKAVKDRNKDNVLNTLGSVLGSQAFYFLPGLGISKLKGLNALTGLNKLSTYLGIGASSLLESSGEAGSVYLDEKKRWKDITGDEKEAKKIASGKADFTFMSNIIINMVTNRLGGMFDNVKASGLVKEGLGYLNASFEEGSQEGLQQFISNIAEDRPITEGSKEAAVYGAILGGIGGGGDISHTKVKRFSDLLTNEDREIISGLGGQKGTLDLKAVKKDITNKITKKAPVIKERIKAENRAVREKNIATEQIEKIRRVAQTKKLIQDIKTRDIKKTLQGDIKAVKETFNNKIEEIKRGIELGNLKGKILDREVLKTKEEFVKMASSLPLNERGKLLKMTKNVKTNKQLVSGIAYINKLGDQAAERSALSSIRNNIKKTKATGKRPKGKYTPAIQNEINKINSIIEGGRLSQKKAKEKIAKNVSEGPTTKTLTENNILSMYVGDAQKKQELADKIKNLKETGATVFALRKGNYAEEINRKAGYVVSQITGGKGIDPSRLRGEADKKTAAIKIKQFLKTIGKNTVLDWKGLLTAAEFNASVKNTSLADIFSVGENESNYKRFVMGYVDSFNTAVSNIYNIKNTTNSIHKLVHKISTEKVVIDDMKMTRDELIKRYMEIQDPTLEQSFRDGNNYTDETFKAIEDTISPKDKAFAEWQLSLYQKLHPLVNKVYSSINMVDLPNNDKYSPIKREGYSIKPGETDFGNEIKYRAAVTNGSLISRSKNVYPIKRQGSMVAMDKHFMDMGYYIAWAEKMKEIDTVFSRPEVRMAFEQEHTAKFAQSFYKMIDNMAVNRNRHASNVAWLDKVRKSYVVGNLAVKPALTIKQLVSTMAYYEKLSATEFITGVLDFMRHPVKNYNTLQNESTFIKARGSNLDRDLKNAMDEGLFERFSKTQSMYNLLLLNVKLGDKGAIILGSWAMRRARLAKNSNANMDEIISEYEEFGADTQQSSDISRMSLVQTGGSFEKLFTVFKSSQRAYFQKELNAVRSTFRKDGFSKQNVKKVAKILFIYHEILPVLFQFVANMGGWSDEDKKDYKRAAILGSFNGIIIAGDLIDKVLRYAMGMQFWDKKIIIEDTINDVINSTKILTDDDITPTDISNALDAGASAATGLTGLPIEYSYDALESLHKGNYERGIKLLAGWGEYTVDAHTDNTKNESTIDKLKRLKKEKSISETKKRLKKLKKKR